MRIELTKGFVAIVDEADFAALSAHRWHAHGSGAYVYAARKVGPRGARTLVLMHRQLVGALDGEEVDHINGDTLDTRRANLRRGTRADNQANRAATKRSKSGFKGVSFDRGRWRALINRNGTRHYLGRFTSPELAARAYDAKATELQGAFARRNLPEGK